MFNSTSKKLGAQVIGPTMHQFARVDFDKLNKRNSTESSKVKLERPITNNELLMESYQDILKGGE